MLDFGLIPYPRPSLFPRTPMGDTDRTVFDINFIDFLIMNFSGTSHLVPLVLPTMSTIWYGFHLERQPKQIALQLRIACNHWILDNPLYGSIPPWNEHQVRKPTCWNETLGWQRIFLTFKLHKHPTCLYIVDNDIYTTHCVNTDTRYQVLVQMHAPVTHGGIQIALETT